MIAAVAMLVPRPPNGLIPAVGTLRLLVLAAVALAVAYVVTRALRRGRHGGEQVCVQCGEANPPHASFCRRCGREFVRPARRARARRSRIARASARRARGRP